MPQSEDPIHRPWSDPLPALDGWGASVSAQVVPLWVSISPHAFPDVSLYQPTVTQPLAAGQADDEV